MDKPAPRSRRWATLPVGGPAAGSADPARPDYAAILAAHGRALAAAEEGYLDPATGYWCFTAAYLWDRGTCCDSGCRHCPYVNQAARLGRGPGASPPDRRR